MTRHLCISVTLLDPVFHGRSDQDQPEWPPSPYRLFQALVAGALTASRAPSWNDQRAAAFRWLESLKPPMIIAPEGIHGTSICYFVPSNEGDKAPQREDRLTSKVARPTWLRGGDTIHYLWPLDEASDPSTIRHAEMICKEARHIRALGWGIDQAVANGCILDDHEVSALRGHCWRPWNSNALGGRKLRTPRPGSLEDLARAYDSFLKRLDDKCHRYRPPRRPSCFNITQYLKTTTIPSRPYAAFELSEGIAFRQERICEVAAMVRSLVCKYARDDTHPFPGGPETYVAGHISPGNPTTPPRFSYLPLPTIGHAYADGFIRRILVAEPYDGDGSHARWLRIRLHNQTLTDVHGNQRGILSGLWRKSSNRIIGRYLKESTHWSTVTPVILPGFDDGKRAKAEKLVLRALAHANLPVHALVSLTLQKTPFWHGSYHSSQYFRPDYLKRLPAWHIALVFHHPIGGPIAIGAGRHCGLGLFAAPKSEEPP